MTSKNAPLVVGGLNVEITVIQGRGLVAKDRNVITRKKTSSDPYVKVFCENRFCGQTKTEYKTLAPRWNQTFKTTYGISEANKILNSNNSIVTIALKIFDEDGMTEDDSMGVVVVPIQIMDPPSTNWYPVGKGHGSTYCKNATGEVEVKVSITGFKILNMIRGNSHTLDCSVIRVGLGWEMEAGRAIDLDSSCVSIDYRGNVLMDETVYFGDNSNTNGSIYHSGDEREGDENLGGSGDDEIIMCHLNTIPRHVRALYFILTVATPQKTFADVESASVTVTNAHNGTGLCHFTPSFSGDHTAMFLMRIARSDREGKWIMSIIEDSDPTARDFGSLIPEIKGYSRDIVPNINIDPKERIAVMRKGGAIRIADYCNPIADKLTFGLAWDVTNGVNIDLDASAICLDESLNLVDIVYFNHLVSHDGCIRHGGDEREGDEKGDDEKIFLDLNRISEEVKHIGFVINSYSGQELDDISSAYCHLYHSVSKTDISLYHLSNSRELDKHTGLVMASIYRDSGEWFMRIISEAAHGRVAEQLVDELQVYLRNNPPQQATAPPEPEIVVNAMPDPVPIDEEIVVEPTIPLYQMA